MFYWFLPVLFSPLFLMAGVQNDLSDFHQLKTVAISFNKKVNLKLLRKTSKSQGTFLASREKFRLVLKKPEKKTVIFDGENLWLLEYLNESKNPQVSRMKTDAQTVFFWNFLRKPALIRKYFRVRKRRNVYYLTSLGKAPYKKMEILFSSGQMKKVTHWDNIGNRTQILIKKMKRNLELSPYLFTHKRNRPSTRR